MPRTRRRYTWTIHHEDPLMPTVLAPGVRRTCDFWVSRFATSNNNFYDPSVGGEMMGLLQVSITVEARDQWQVHRQAIRFARTVASVCRVRLVQLGDPEPAKLKPHMNRGFKARRRRLAAMATVVSFPADQVAEDEAADDEHGQGDPQPDGQVTGQSPA